jgi:hypothetical protein
VDFRGFRHLTSPLTCLLQFSQIKFGIFCFVAINADHLTVYLKSRFIPSSGSDFFVLKINRMKIKRICLGWLLCSISWAALAQDSSKINIQYWSTQGFIGGTGTGIVFGVSGDVLLSNKIVVGLDVSQSNFKPLLLPTGYFSLIPFIQPKDNIQSCTLLFGICLTSKDKFARLSLDAGPGYRRYAESHFTYHPEDPGLITVPAFYSRVMEIHESGGFLLESRVDLCWSRFFALAFTGTVDLNQYKILPAYRVGILLGKLHN